MKKLFTLLLALVAATGISASAQDMKFYVFGEGQELGQEVKDGDRIDLTDHYDEIMGWYAPHLKLLSAYDYEVEVTANFISGETDPVYSHDKEADIEIGAKLQLSVCSFGNCVFANAGQFVTKVGEVTEDVPENLQIELVCTPGYDQKFEDLGVKAEFSVTAVNEEDEEITVTFFVDKKSTGVDGVEVDSNAEAVYYDLQGRQVDNPAKGLYIVKRGGKVTKEFVK